MAYNVVETTNMYGSKCLSFQANEDIENGFLVAKGDLVTGEKEIYKAEIPTDSDEVYLVANPAWSYNGNSAVDQNEDNFINKTDIAFRGYQLKKDNKFKVYSTGVEPISGEKPLAVGQYITVGDSTYKPKAVESKPETGFIGKIVDIEEMGFPYCVGSLGKLVNIGSKPKNSMGYAVDTRVTKVTIEVIKNA